LAHSNIHVSATGYDAKGDLSYITADGTGWLGNVITAAGYLSMTGHETGLHSLGPQPIVKGSHLLASCIIHPLTFTDLIPITEYDLYNFAAGDLNWMRQTSNDSPQDFSFNLPVGANAILILADADDYTWRMAYAH
jgi:hypothetical protein